MAELDISRNDTLLYKRSFKKFEKTTTVKLPKIGINNPLSTVVNFSKIIPNQTPQFHVQPSDIKAFEKSSPSTHPLRATTTDKVRNIGLKIFPPPPTYSLYDAHRHRMKKSEESIGKSMSLAAREFIGTTSGDVWDKSDPFEYESTFGHYNNHGEDNVEKSRADAVFERLFKDPLCSLAREDNGLSSNTSTKEQLAQLVGIPKSPIIISKDQIKLTKDFDPVNGLFDLVSIGGYLHPRTDDRMDVSNNFPKPSAATQRDKNGDTLSHAHHFHAQMPKQTPRPRFRLEINVEGFENNEVYFQTNDSVIIVTALRSSQKNGLTAKKLTEIIELPKGLYPENICVYKTEHGKLLFSE